MTLLGIAALAAAAMIVVRAEAADKDAIQKIINLVKAGKNDDAKAAAKKYAAAHPEVDELMDAFGKKSGLAPVGVEQTMIKFGRDTQSPAALGKADYQDVGAILQAVGMVTAEIPAPKSPKGSQADWSKWAKEISDNGSKLQAAIKSKTPADVKMISTKINNACNSCHTAFKI